MSDPVWYVYQKNQQLGPFDRDQLLKLIDSNMVAHNAFVFKVGWKDWVPMLEASEEIGIDKSSLGAPPPPPAEPEKAEKEEKKEEPSRTAPRASIHGRIIVHNNGQLVLGSGVNISATGIFVETPEQIFDLGEDLKLTCRVDGFSKPFNAVASVIRFNNDTRYPIGYGLRFKKLEESISERIQKLIDDANKARAAAEQAN